MRSRQLEIRFRTWGGKRRGAGRKRTLPGRPRVEHRRRPVLSRHHAAHVTVRICQDVPRLRNRLRCKAIRAALIGVLDQPGFRIVQFSVQHDHLHLLCEADDTPALSRGVGRFKIRLAKELNRQLGRQGPVFCDRYHMQVLSTPRQTRNAICYVLHNSRKHKVYVPSYAGGVDPYSSAWWFDGWNDGSWRSGLSPPSDQIACVSPAQTWLLSVGWQRTGGRLRVDEMPAGARRCATR